MPWETSCNEVFCCLGHKSQFFFNEKLKDCTMKTWIQSDCSFLFCKCEFLSQYETDNVFFRCKVNPFSFLSFAFFFSCSYSATSTTYGTWCCCWNRFANMENQLKCLQETWCAPKSILAVMWLPGMSLCLSLQWKSCELGLSLQIWVSLSMGLVVAQASVGLSIR